MVADELRQEFHAACARQREVEQHQRAIGMHGEHALGFGAMGRREHNDRRIEIGQGLRDGMRDQRMVVDNEQLRHGPPQAVMGGAPDDGDGVRQRGGRQL